MHPSAVTDHSGLGKSYTYDPNGNMLTRGNQTLTWDIDNRVLSISIAGGGTTSMEYDYSGTRVKKSAPGGITLYPFAGYEIDPNGVVTKYIRIGDESVASKRGASKYFYHNDHLGSVNVVTDINGSRVQLLEYDPWGAISRSEGTLDPDQRFTGQKLDPETGLYYYGGRYYDAEIGRFISADPFVQSPFDPQNLNRYSYVLNSPQNYTDPDGYFHKIKKKKGGFFRSFFGFFVGAIVAVLTGGAGGAPLWVAAVTGATVGGAVNAALNGGNPFLAGLMGGFTAGLLGGLMPPGFESPALGSAAAASHLGVFASSFAPGMSRTPRGLIGCEACSTTAPKFLDSNRRFNLGDDAVDPPLNTMLVRWWWLPRGIFRTPRPPVSQPKPPGWSPEWQWRYPENTTKPTSPRWFDPNGGEWRWHAPDKWHPEGHWDYNPWDSWNSPWRNVPPARPVPQPIYPIPDLVPYPWA